MQFLTEYHEEGPSVFYLNGVKTYSHQLIDQEDYATLESLGLYRHYVEGLRPHGDWVESSDSLGTFYFKATSIVTAEDAEEHHSALGHSASITRLQARLALLGTPDPTGNFDNAWDAVEAWANTTGGATLAYFEDTTHWSRFDQFVLSGAKEFGWDDEELTALFNTASQL